MQYHVVDWLVELVSSSTNGNAGRITDSRPAAPELAEQLECFRSRWLPLSWLANGALAPGGIDDAGVDGATGPGAVPCSTIGTDEGFGCWKTQS